MFACRRPLFDGRGQVAGAALMLSPQVEKALERALAGAGTAGEKRAEVADASTPGSGPLVYLDRLRESGELFVLLHAPEDDGPGVLAQGLRARGMGIASRSLESPGDLLVVEVGDLQAPVPAGSPAAIVAWGVASQEDAERARGAGATLFEGPHHLQVRPPGGQDASSSTSAILRLLALLGDDDSANSDVVEALRADPGVSYKLLRLVNSSGEEELDGSLEFALRVMGRTSLYRWLSVLLLRVQGDRSAARDEVILTCLTRGRFAEQLRRGPRSALVRDLPEPGACFLLGLFSRLDALMGTPMERILAGLQLHPEVEGALLRREGAGGTLLEIAEAVEAAAWPRLEGLLAAHGVEPEQAGEVWLDAGAWALEQVATPH